MRVVHVAANDGRGGAALASWRLHRALLEHGVDSRLLVYRKHSVDNSVEALAPVPFTDPYDTATESVIERVYCENNRTSLTDTHFSLPLRGVDLSRNPSVRAADLIHLHWVASFQTPATVSALLSLGKPVVWTLHDAEPFTGGCHFPAGCRGFERSCSTCPQLRCDPLQVPSAALHDKRAQWPLHDLTLIAPSHWMADLARASAVFRGTPRIRVLPNGVDACVFRPAERAQALDALGLAHEPSYLLCGSDQLRQQRKGYDQLGRVLRATIADPRLLNVPVSVVWVGSSDSPWPDDDLPVNSLGRLTSDTAMALAYAAADVFVVSSLEDNLPNMLLEAMSCGTPVVAYGVGGIPEAVTDGVNGRIVAPGSERGLTDATVDLLTNHALREAMGGCARARVEERYSYPVLAAQHVELYSGLLAARDARLHAVPPYSKTPSVGASERPDTLLEKRLPRLALRCLVQESRILQQELSAAESERQLQSLVIGDLRTELSARMAVVHGLENELAARLRLIEEQELQRQRREADVAAAIALLQNELAARLRLIEEQEFQRQRREADVAAEIELLQNELAARLRLIQSREAQHQPRNV